MRIFALILAGMLMLLGCASASSLLEENFALLESLGFEIPEKVRTDISQSIDETLAAIPDEIRDQFGYSRDYFSDIPTILAWVGYGDFDYETGNTTHYSDDLYAFDTEMYDVEGGYLELLYAVERLSGGAVEIENYEIEIGEDLFLRGEGEFPISFELNGQACEYTAKLQTDWMDCGIINYINRILKEQGFAESIWSMYDGGQGLVIFYNDSDWARSFEAATGCELVRGVETYTVFDSILDLFF